MRDGLTYPRSVRLYRDAGLILSILFAIVGAIFLAIPDGVLRFMNDIAELVGMKPAPASGFSFYLVLAAAYMYVVSLLAYRMFSLPDDDLCPMLLVNAKGASAVISIGALLFQGGYFVYAANAFVDGSIAIGVLILWRSRKGAWR